MDMCRTKTTMRSHEGEGVGGGGDLIKYPYCNPVATWLKVDITLSGGLGVR